VVIGPDAQSVFPQRILKEMTYHTPSAMDYPVLQPGKSWTLTSPFSFPQQDANFTRFLLQHPGAYQLRFLYAFVPNKAELQGQTEMATGAFQGMVASNSITFSLLEASQASQGLQMALQAKPSSDPLSGDIMLTAYLRNVSAKPITIDSWDLLHNGLQLSGDDGKVIPFGGGSDRSRTPTLAERYTTVPPGEKHAFPLHGGYRAALDTLTQQVGRYNVTDNTGFFREWSVPGHAVHAVALLEMTETTAEQQPTAPGPLWHGKVTSPAISIQLNPTSYRQAKLKSMLSHFAFEMNYSGARQDKPYYSLRLQVEPVSTRGAIDAFSPVVQISETAAGALIDYLATNGALRDMNAIEFGLARVAVPATDGYTILVSGIALAGEQDLACWSHNLGWNLSMYRALKSLQAQLPIAGQTKMDLLLTRLSGLHEIWEAEDALQLPTVTLDTSAGTLSDAANAIITTLHAPGVKLSIDAFTGATPINAYHFFNVTANEAFQSLAAATDVNFTPRGANATFHAWVN